VEPHEGHETDASDDADNEATDRSPPFFVVGIGASAGGLEAITALLSRVSGAAAAIGERPRHGEETPGAARAAARQGEGHDEGRQQGEETEVT
jgi:hypothetical protein